MRASWERSLVFDLSSLSRGLTGAILKGGGLSRRRWTGITFSTMWATERGKRPKFISMAPMSSVVYARMVCLIVRLETGRRSQPARRMPRFAVNSIAIWRLTRWSRETRNRLSGLPGRKRSASKWRMRTGSWSLAAAMPTRR
jgi:hypothetical protein